MRNFAPTLALLLVTALLPLAAAHRTHDVCSSNSATEGQVHVDFYRGECVGATVSTGVLCSTNFDFGGEKYVHVLVLYGAGCQTGVILNPPPLP